MPSSVKGGKDEMHPWSEIRRRIPWLLFFGFVPGLALGLLLGWWL